MCYVSKKKDIALSITTEAKFIYLFRAVCTYSKKGLGEATLQLDLCIKIKQDVSQTIEKRVVYSAL